MRQCDCVDAENGWPCVCYRRNKNTSQQAEDEGYADWKNDDDRDREELDFDNC